jgi:hypothetical protein
LRKRSHWSAPLPRRRSVFFVKNAKKMKKIKKNSKKDKKITFFTCLASE